MITSIKFDKKTFEGEGYSIIGDKNLNNLNRINVFIGKNNSGKSRLLRLLLKNRFDVETVAFDSREFNSYLNNFKKQANEYLYQYDGNNGSLFHLFQAIKEIPELSYVTNDASVREIKVSIENLTTTLIGLPLSAYNSDSRQILSNYQYSVTISKRRILSYLNQFNDDVIDFEKIYIPVLRGLRPVQTSVVAEKEVFLLSENNYLKRSQSDYKIQVGEKIRIHTGLDLYQQVTNLLLGKHDDRLKIWEFEDYLSKTFFQGNEVNIIPRIDDDVLYIKIGNEEERKIYELGDGIQAIILLIYPLFFNEGKKMLFFIEEPELHLHPGLERVLIETMRDERFSTFQYFITTHSNHILDLTLEYDDISIYSFQKKVSEKENIFSIQNVSSGDKQVLDQLGVRNSSVFLANCTIWVEGITDRLYLKKYLEVLQKGKNRVFKEDYHYAFIEYGGNNITHWSFLEIDDAVVTTINTEGICSKILLIVDNDGAKGKKLERQKQLKKKLGDNFYVTEGKEMENLLSEKVIKNTIMEIEGVSTTLNFSKFDRKSYSKIGLGKFIAENVEGIKSVTRYSNSNSGTINSNLKLEFCKKAFSKIKSENDLSDEAKKLGGLLLDFIEKNNSKTY